MKRTRPSGSWTIPLLVLLAATACGPAPRPAPEPGPGPGRVHVGQVRVDAPGVLVNGRPVAGSVPLFIGDAVTTDGTGRATIAFDAGGFLRLGPSTDPLLQLVSEAGCVGAAVLQVIIARGTFDFVNVTRVCFCDLRNEVCGVPASDFRVVVTGAGASITVTRGALRVSVGRPPRAQYRVDQGRGIVVRRGSTPGPQPIIK